MNPATKNFEISHGSFSAPSFPTLVSYYVPLMLDFYWEYGLPSSTAQDQKSLYENCKKKKKKN